MPPIRDPDTSRRVVHNLEGLAADLVLVGQEYQRMRAALLEIAALPDGTPADEFRTRARGALGGASE